jgi:hypothetical protein
LASFNGAPDFGRSAVGTQQTPSRCPGKGLQVAFLLAALVPAVWVLNHPVPVAWLKPVCKDTWPILAICAIAAILPYLFRRAGASAWSLLTIALTQAGFQAWCYNTGSHPAGSPFQMWGIFPGGGDACLYYTAACELVNGQQITAMAGARHSYPAVLAGLLKIFGHDFRLITIVFTMTMAIATWSAFEVIRRRLNGLAAAVYLTCVTFYIRIHCTGLFMTEQLGTLYSLCAVGLLVESLAREGKAKRWLYCGGLFFLTQGLNARPAAYMTLPFLVFTSWEVCHGNFKAKGRMVGLSAIAVAISLFLHTSTYYRDVASPTPSNAWYCIYGLLNGGTWIDGRKHAEQLLRETPSVALADRTQRAEPIYTLAMRILKNDCLSEIRHQPGKLLAGWWRALRFLWLKNIPFRSARPEMPSVWFTESARWSTILGLAFSLWYLFRGRRLAPQLKRYQALSWINLAVLVGMITSLPFAPPWDGETRILAATLPLFFLLPASGVCGLYLLIISSWHRLSSELKAGCHPNIAIGTAVTLGGTLSILTVFTSLCLVGSSSTAKDRPHPVRLMLDELIAGGPSLSSFDLRSLRAGYDLQVTDDTHPTWLPNLSRKDFVSNLPTGKYLYLSKTFNRLPAETELVALPYSTLLVLDKEDALGQRFTPPLAQTGHPVPPLPVYFSRSIHLADQ